MSIQLSQIHTYPLKSGKGFTSETGIITPRGLKYDRHWAVCGADGKALTARTHPKLLNLSPQPTATGISFTAKDLPKPITIPYPSEDAPLDDLIIFVEPATGVIVESEWISDYLGEDCRLFFMSDASNRIALQKRGGQPNDVASYADEAPLLLVSEESLADLNSKLETPVSMTNFRPNLVVKGCDAFAEDEWKFIRIGNCEFEVVQRCKRCVFTTINPDTLEKRTDGEPLRTLATYRRHPRGGVGFGVHLVPRKLGAVSIGDVVEVMRGE